MKKDIKCKESKKMSIDLTKLAEADTKKESAGKPFVATCAICGSKKNIAFIQNKQICLKCIEFIKDN